MLYARITNMSNQTFLGRINFILGGRKKHPWGTPLGFKNTRITEIFKGRIPGADGLEIIHRAEGVCSDWLVAGTGAPYCVQHWADERAASWVAQEAAAGMRFWLAVTAGLDLPPVLVGSKAERREIALDMESEYQSVVMVAGVGAQALAQAGAQHPGLVVLSAEDYRRLADGWLGPWELISQVLPQARALESGMLERLRQVAAGEPSGLSSEDAAVLAAYQSQSAEKRAAYRTLLDVQPQAVQGFVYVPDALAEAMVRDRQAAYRDYQQQDGGTESADSSKRSRTG